MKTKTRYILYDKKYEHQQWDELNNKMPFDLMIGSEIVGENFPQDDIEVKEGEWHNLDLESLKECIKKVCPRPKSVRFFNIKTREEMSEILEIIKEDLMSINLFKCPDLPDFSFLEKIPSLQFVNIFWNRKATALFNAAKMPNLKKFHMLDCNHVVNFDGLKNSNIEDLSLSGCNWLSSFVSKLDAGNLDFLAFMPKLKTLELDIMHTRSDEVYLKAIAKAKTVEAFKTRDKFFTFEQFAWLSAHLPNLKKGLEPCTYFFSWNDRGSEVVDGVDDYYIIGRGKTRAKKALALRYQATYDALKEQFKNAQDPPGADFKCELKR